MNYLGNSSNYALFPSNFALVFVTLPHNFFHWPCPRNMSAEQIIQDVKSGSFKPIYLLYGDEPFFTDQIEHAVVTHALDEAARSFNESILYGMDVNATTLLDYLGRYPMMAPRQLVVVREAQEMKQFEGLAHYFEKPAPTTVLVLSFKGKKPDFRTRAGKALKINAVCFESKKLYNNQIADWIIKESKLHGLIMSPQAAVLLAEYVGIDLQIIENQIIKLAINLQKGAQVTIDHVRTHVGVSKEYNVFELQKAIGERNTAKAMQIVLSFCSNLKKNPLIPVISSLYSYFSKIWVLQPQLQKSEAEQMAALQLKTAYFLKDYRASARNYSPSQVRSILKLLKAYDLKVKGVECNTDEGELMKELVILIFNTSSEKTLA
jgi:DNA polymerase III subunit delta